MTKQRMDAVNANNMKKQKEKQIGMNVNLFLVEWHIKLRIIFVDMNSSSATVAPY